MAVEVVSACYLNVLMLVIQQHDLDTDGLNVAMSLQTSVMWFGTMLLTPGCGCVLVVTSITKISQQPDCFSSLPLFKSVRAVVSYLIRPTHLLRVVFSGSSSAAW